MKKRLLTCAVTASLVLVACNKDEAPTTVEEAPAAQAATYETNIQKMSYGIGINISKNFTQQK